MKKTVSQKISSLKTNWYVWIFPILAICICIALFKDYLEHRGVKIQVSFDDASSIQAEKTKVRFRGVPVGVVKKVTVAENGDEVIAHVTLDKGNEQFAVKGSKYWLVMPKVDFGGISGLETLFSGTYISVQPGKMDAEFEDRFRGQLGKDANEAGEDTVAYQLETDFAGPVSPGDSVNFRGVKVGTVSKVTISKGSQSVLVQINIQNKYVKLIRTNSVFWRRNAIDAKLGLFKSELKIGSFDSLLKGGIDFFTPTQAGEMAKYGSRFTLFASSPKDWEKWNPKLDY